MKGLLAIAGAAAMLILGTTFLIYMLAATDEGVDLSGSDYEDQYDSNTNLAITTLSLLKFIAPILGVCALIVAMFYIKKHSSSR